MKKPSPPKFPLKVLKWFCKPEYHVDIEGDLLELYARRITTVGYRKARLLLFKDVLLLCKPEIIRTFKPIQNLDHMSMLRHNFILSCRSFLRNKTSFLINLTGLSSGLTCVLLIYLWVADELSIDKFHQLDERLYQVMNNLESTENVLTLALTPVPLADALVAEMPEVEYAVAVNDFFSWQTREGILSSGDTHMQAKGWHAGKDFFKVFSYDLVQGDRNQVLRDKNSIVISDVLAKKLFNTTDAMGKTLEWKHPLFEGVFHVSGIFKTPPANATAQFDFLISMEVLLDNDRWAKQWTGNYAATYITLREGTDISQFNGVTTRTERSPTCCTASGRRGSICSRHWLMPAPSSASKSAGSPKGVSSHSLTLLQRGFLKGFTAPARATMISLTVPPSPHPMVHRLRRGHDRHRSRRE